MYLSRLYVFDVLKFTIPLVISSLSSNLMMTVDRFVLAYYSLDAMNAVSLSSTFVGIFSLFFIGIAMIATVFVGQYNGALEYKKTSWPVWQMIYWGLFSTVLFVPLSLSTSYTGFFPDFCRAEGIAYQSILLFFAPVSVIYTALAAFFMGRKKSILIIVVVMTGNIINIGLDILLVFGIRDVFNPMGAAGAAWATAFSQVMQVVILLSIFLNKKHRTNYATLDKKFRKDLFFKCIKVGAPFAFGRFCGLIAWYLMLLLFGYASRDLSTVVSIEYTMYIMFIFFSNGCENAVSSLSSNLIGANDLEGIKKLFKTFMLINIVISFFFAIPLVFYQELIFHFLYMADQSIKHMHGEIVFLLYSLWINVCASGIFASVCGILISGGDTKFPMIIDILSTWLFGVVPAAILFFTGNLTSAKEVYTCIPIGCILMSIIVYRRYTKLKWFKHIV